MNLTIRTKLLSGFGILLLLLTGIGLLMTNKLSESNDRLKKIVEVSEKKVELSHEIMIDVLHITRYEKNMILENDDSRKQKYIDQIAEYSKSMDTKVQELEILIDSAGMKYLQEFADVWTLFQLNLDSMVYYSKKDETDRAFAISISGGRDNREAAIAALDKIILKNNAEVIELRDANAKSYDTALQLIIGLIVFSVLLVGAMSYWIISSISKRIRFIAGEGEKVASREFTDQDLLDNARDELSQVFNSLVSTNTSFREVTRNADTVARGDYSVDFVPRSDKDLLGRALKKMTGSLRETTAANEKHNWLTTGQNRLNEQLVGELNLEKIGSNIIGFLCTYLDAGVGTVYFLDEKSGMLTVKGTYAYSSTDEIKQQFAVGEGLIGQAAAEKKLIVLTDIPEKQMRITSSVLNAKPANVLISPFLFEGNIIGVVEIARLTPFTETEKEFMGPAMETIGIAVNSAVAREKIRQLLEETQVQSEELQAQQEELRQVNEELEEQAQNLRQQQEELQMTNEELEEQTQSLEVKNREVEAARVDIEQKTKQLEISSKYKSEFLANMSHELRTPLNSLLILSRDLAENKNKNLDEDQVESAEIIHKSGQDLLNLINEVLDLSKIEAGKMTVHVDRVTLQRFTDALLRDFRHQAEKKSLRLTASIAPDVPESIRTDEQRLNQIMKNLLSNALKFTEKGSVTINIQKHDAAHIAISVSDTGIGVPEDKQMAIFEAFKQADGGTSRKYGGTGLGLSISRELARLLGAQVSLKSKVGEGSVFTLIIPVELNPANETPKAAEKTPAPAAPVPSVAHNGFLNYPALEDDRASIQNGDKVVLVIEDDLKFADILMKLARSKGFKCLSAATGEDGLVLVRKYNPAAVLLDIDLPGMNGHHVLSELKSDPAVRHIPVHILSVNERTIEPIKAGAVEYLVKPVDKKDLEEAFNRIEGFVSRKMKNLLIVEDDENSRKAMRKLIGNGDVKCFEAANGEQAIRIYKETHIDCIVLDIGLPDISGFDLIYRIEEISEKSMPPIIIYTGKELTREENAELQKYAETIIIKGVRSEERLLDETALFLHRAVRNLPEAKRSIIQNLYDKEAAFTGKKILLVDDDMRNIFALSKILRDRGMEVIKAENGRVALEVLDSHEGIDLVLMDIMMPEMDGYEAMGHIRKKARFRDLPIIALTAKAMKEDKQKCIAAGASDYITKPVDVERLLTLMRVWLDHS